jgi:hypothetical protein
MKKSLLSQAKLAEDVRMLMAEQVKREAELVSLLAVALGDLAKSRDGDLVALVLVLERQLEIRKESGATDADLSAGQSLVSMLRLIR